LHSTDAAGLIAARLPAASLMYRIACVPICVALCYAYDWAWLRGLTTDAVLELAAMSRLPMQRIDFDTVELADLRIHFVVACTFIDAFCGAIPLLWRTSTSVLANISRLALLLVVLLVANTVRLHVGFIAYANGVPWSVAHECVAGVCYFGFLYYIVRERAWASSQPAAA
jgi:hypothetical protein